MHSSDRRPLTLLSLTLSVACCLNFAAPCLAISSNVDSSLSQLETRFFEHDYSSDTSSARLERLEKLVFGESKSGSNDERLTKLTNAVKNPYLDRLGGKPAPFKQADPTAVASAPEPQPLPKPQPKPSKTAVTATDSHKQQFASDNYEPSVAPSHTNGPETANITPFTDEYSAHNNNNSVPPYAAPNGVSIEQHISLLEQQVHGHTNKGRPLPERLTQLENAAFANSADHSGSLADRVGRLSSAVGVDVTSPQSLASTTPLNAAPSPFAPPTSQYQTGYAQQSQFAAGAGYQQQYAPTNGYNQANVHKGHPMLKTAAKTALVVGAVAGVAALTIAATHGMGGGCMAGGLLRKGLHFDRD